MPFSARIRLPRPAALLLLAGLAATPAAAAESPALPRATPTPCTTSIPEVYETVSPAVVSVTALVVDPRNPLDHLNRQAGSGVIVDRRGLVVTNSHVVFGHQAITVTLDDGTVLPAKIVGIDPILDVAVLRIPTPQEGQLPTASFGDSDALRVGDEVFAIGNPFGLEQTLTRGIVSAVNRILPGASWSSREPLIQTDAAINHGNSGGPLVDRCGKVVGIATAILPEAQGIGFAIPSGLIGAALPELVEKGHVVRPWLGVQGQVVPPAWKAFLRLPPVDGFLVEVVEPESPAAKAGLTGGDQDLVVGGTPLLIGGDVLVELNGVSLADPAKVSEAIRSLKVGDTARVVLVRGDQTIRLEVPLAERPILPQDVFAGRTAIPAATPSTAPRSGRRSL